MSAFSEWVVGGGVDRSRIPTTEERGYLASYVWLRIIVGVLGLLLPLVLFAGEAFWLDAPLHARDSISSYYHSPMRDWFVASLSVIGILLITYMLGAWKNFEFWASTVAGAGLIGVAFFPTERSGLPPGAAPCETTPKPVDCTDLEHRLGEVTTGNIHLTCAAIALAFLGVIAFAFATRAWKGEDRRPNKGLAAFQFTCGSTIAVALLIAVSGEVSHWRLWGLTPLYIGEVVTVLAFGACWIAQGRDLRRWLRSMPPPTPAIPEPDLGEPQLAAESR